mmetsp:Transcript_61657/g.143448  ORF Transcript_61657/g.143448 Transcript_61657/m.143448 type:complete len:356 (-) Transcript_61657:116-1183(-)
MVHERPNHLTTSNPEGRFVLVRLVIRILVLTSFSFGPVFLLLLSPLEGLVHYVQGNLANLLQLLKGEDGLAGLLEASSDAICAGLERSCIHAVANTLCQLGQHTLEEAVHQPCEDLTLTASASDLTELTPRLKGQGTDLLRHRKLKDWQQSFCCLHHERSIMLAKLLCEGVDALHGILQVLHCRSAHDQALHIPILVGHQCQVHFLVIVDVVFCGAVEFLRSKLELFKDTGQDVGQERQEVSLHRPADALGCLQHVLLHWIARWQVRHRHCLDHGLHDALHVCTESGRAHGLCKQRRALESLAKHRSLCRIVQHFRDELLQDGHQLPVVLGEAILHLVCQNCNEGHRVPPYGKLR